MTDFCASDLIVFESPMYMSQMIEMIISSKICSVVLRIVLRAGVMTFIQLQPQNMCNGRDFVCDISAKHFLKIADDPTHPLFHYIQRNTGRMSSRKPTIYRPEQCRTTKRAKSFFQFFMSFFNNNSFLSLAQSSFQVSCTHLFLSILILNAKNKLN